MKVTIKNDSDKLSRRSILKSTGMAMLTVISASSILMSTASASDKVNTEKSIVKHKAYVYTEVQNSAPTFNDIPWKLIYKNIKAQPGFINKTWLYGTTNGSGGGLYVFDTIENAQKFVTGYFPEEARSRGVAQTTRIFDAVVTEVASRDMNSMHYDGKIDQEPGAYIYTEVQLHALPFNKKVPWKQLNLIHKQQPGLLAKTWLSGLHTGTAGGFYAFDTIENAKKFAIEYFPTEAKKLNAAFYTRVFDAKATRAASIEMNSPFYDKK